MTPKHEIIKTLAKMAPVTCSDFKAAETAVIEIRRQKLDSK